MISQIFVLIIRFIHINLIIATLYIPFQSSKKTLLHLYTIVVPFMILKWFVNDDLCFLTLLESKIRNVNINESFFHSLISPIYNLNNDVIGKIIKSVTFILLFIACLNLKEFNVDKHI